ncbi:putative dipeptidase [Tolypocladium ophioglossoides CBS 100239]|uniref:Dipeptidase n=1 Tax=Tolypocladium ophioglossoides (strain CBS 100239) TaxID=1163406 RepID=A0A0L0NHG2_TOLOC|nr:putative dipeptidase [Tolypocladium ophioglossoides CBS 100239]
MAAASRPVLPSSSKGYASLDEEPGQHKARELTPYRLILYVFLALFFLGAVQKPVAHCYRRVSDHVCQRHMSVEKRARRILARTPLIGTGTYNLRPTLWLTFISCTDGHVDFAVAMRYLYGNRVDNSEWAQSFENGTLLGHVDLARLRTGQSGGAFWSVFAPCPTKGDDFSDENLAASVQYTLDQIDVTARAFGAYPRDFAMRLDSSDAVGAFKAGKLVSPFGIEGLHQIGNSAANLRLFHDLGVRYATLTHNCHNKFADAALLENPPRKAKPHWGGVSPLGRRLVHEMNRIGMIVDLAHVSDDTMLDVLGGRDDWEGSKAPVLFSHSSAWSICPHPRNVKDHVLQLVKERNSLVMVNISPGFISCVDVGDDLPEEDLKNATLDQIVKHITHIGNFIGYDHVGIGTDFDGIPEVLTGFEDVTKYPDLVAALLRAGVSDSDAAKVVGGNALRVWKDVEAVSAEMKAKGAPVMEDERKGP